MIGGGNGGLSVAGRLERMGVEDIVVVEPRSEHLYKPLFSHIAGGTAPGSMAVREQGAVMPKGVGWVQDAVTAVDPEEDSVLLESGSRLTYDHLIVSAGNPARLGRGAGARRRDADAECVIALRVRPRPKSSALLRAVRSGTVIFVQPAGPASCAGAAQKPMYLACDYWQKTGVLGDIHVIMLVPDETVFGIPEIDRELERKIAEYGIDLRTATEMTEVDAANRLIDRPPAGS